MTRILRIVAITCLSVLWISLLAACNNPIVGRSPGGSIKLPAPAAIQPTVVPTAALAQPAATAASTPQSGGATSVQSDPQGDDLDQALNDLTNDLNSSDTLNDLQ